jgi:hypothetical protein
VSLRVAVIGNCHAQYFGAALATVPGVKVRTVGLAYPGPIGFGGILPKLVHGREVQAWLEAGGPTLVLHQIAPGTRLDLYERITRERPHPLVRFPYVKFDAAVMARPRRADVAADRAYNSAAFEAAGYPLAVLDSLERMIASEPVLFEYNHFAGALFAVLFQAMIEAGLAQHAPRAALEALHERMAADRGISHAISPVQQKRWRSPLVGRLNRPAEVWAEVRARDLPDIEAHSLFAAAALRYRQGGRPACMGVLLTLYRRRLHSTWADIIVDALAARGRIALAMIVLGRRIGWEDARGTLFTRALTLAAQIRKDPVAYDILRRFAARRPRSTLPLLLQCCDQIRP